MKPKAVSLFLVVSVAGIVLCAGVFAPEARAGNNFSFSQAELFFEENVTDEDLGIHFNIDGEAWRRVLLFGPDFSLLLNISDREKLSEIGLTQVNSESAEPGHEVIPREEFLGKFPEGIYLFIGVTTGGDFLLNNTIVTHDIPGPSELISPKEDAEVDSTRDLNVRWTTVDDPNPPFSVIELYEVIVEKIEPGEPVRVFMAEMSSKANSLRVPKEFLEAGKQYKAQILAEETSGNRASIEIPFTTLP